MDEGLMATFAGVGLPIVFLPAIIGATSMFTASEQTEQLSPTAKGILAAEELEPDASTTVDETVNSDFLTSKNPVEAKTDAAPAEVEKKIEGFRLRIEGALSKSVQGIVEAGQILKEACKELALTYETLVAKLPISLSTAGYLIKIADHEVLSNSEYWAKLPSSYNTLYYLSMLDPSGLEECIKTGKVNPGTTLAEAKGLSSAQADGGKGVAKTASGTSEEGYVKVVLSVPKDVDRNKLLEDVEKLAKEHQGLVDLRKSEPSLREWRRDLAVKAAEDGIAATTSAMKNATLEQLRKLEAAAARLLKAEKEEQDDDGESQAQSGGDPVVPKDHPDYAELSTLLKQAEISKKVIKKWCKEQAVPTRLALQNVSQEVYVWEQLRLVAAKEDAKQARKRLERLVLKNSNQTISGLAKQALDEIAKFAD